LLGEVAHLHGNLIKGLEIYEECLEISQENNLVELIRSCYKNIGFIWFYRSEYDRAKDYFDKAYALCHEVQDQVGAALLKSNIGLVYQMKGNYQQALKMFQESSATAESSGDLSSWAQSLHNIATVQIWLGKLDDARQNFQKALAIFEELGSPNKVAMSMNNLGSVLWERDMLQDALEAFEQAYEIFCQLEHRLSAAACLVNIGTIHLDSNKLDKAEKCLISAKEKYQEIGPSPGFTECEIQNIRLLIRKKLIAEAEAAIEEVNLEVNCGPITAAVYHLGLAELGIAQEAEKQPVIDPVEHLEHCLLNLRDHHQGGFQGRVRKILAEYLISSGRDPEKGRELLEQINS